MLYLLRHAKSDWEDPSLSDHDRPLAPRGRRAAAHVAEHMAAQGYRPALVLCSSARRAVDTLALVAPALGGCEVRVEDGLYGATAHELLARLRRIGQEMASVLVVGHNPGMHDLTAQLAGDGEERAMAQLRAKFPTAALAVIDFDDGARGWDALAPGGAYLADLVVPPKA